MKNNFTLIKTGLLAIVCLFSVSIFAQLPGVDFFTGTGTSEDPIKISTYDEFDSLCGYFAADGADGLSDFYVTLEADIDASGASDTLVSMAYFNGHFDGKDHTIDGLLFKAASPKQGLFGWAKDTASIKNLKLTNVTAVLSNRGGVIYGQMQEAMVTIENVTVKGMASSTSPTGGLVGRAQGGHLVINNCLVELHHEIRGESENEISIGGLIGTIVNADPIEVSNSVIKTKAAPINGGILDVVCQSDSADHGAKVTTTNVYYNADSCLYGATTAGADTAAVNAFGAIAVAQADWGTAASFAGLDFENVWGIVDGEPVLNGGSDIPDALTENEITGANVFVSNDELIVESVTEVTGVVIYSLTGKALIQTKDTEIAINELPRGLYIAKIYSGRKSFSTKFIK